MNITILANSDLASNFALNRLLGTLAGKHSLSVFLSSKVGGNHTVPEELVQLKFFEQALFNDLLFPALRGSPCTARLLGFTALAQTHGINIVKLNKINSDEGLVSLAESNPDLILSIRYGGILKESAIAMPSLGVLNLHSGLLPDYRGVMATFFAMLNGETEIGTTLHAISDAGIDTGKIIATTRKQLDYSHSYLWNVLHLYPAGVDKMLAEVERISRGDTMLGQEQVDGGNYNTFPTSAQLHRFAEKGFRLYDVNEVLEFGKHYLEP